jgi:hypothetical protein
MVSPPAKPTAHCGSEFSAPPHVATPRGPGSPSEPPSLSKPATLWNLSAPHITTSPHRHIPHHLTSQARYTPSAATPPAAKPSLIPTPHIGPHTCCCPPPRHGNPFYTLRSLAAFDRPAPTRHCPPFNMMHSSTASVTPPPFDRHDLSVTLSSDIALHHCLSFSTSVQYPPLPHGGGGSWFPLHPPCRPFMAACCAASRSSDWHAVGGGGG